MDRNRLEVQIGPGTAHSPAPASRPHAAAVKGVHRLRSRLNTPRPAPPRACRAARPGTIHAPAPPEHRLSRDLIRRRGGEIQICLAALAAHPPTHRTRAATATSGPMGCSANSNDVTTPKLLPAPRTAQNRSVLLSLACCTNLPLGEHHFDRAKIVDRHPTFLSIQLMPPCSV